LQNTDTVGEFPSGVDWPDLGKMELTGKANSAIPDASAEFANSINTS
jgi:hypothetical protein